MEYRVFSDKIVARIDRGEEICEQLKVICLKEGVALASVSAIGAVGEFTVGVFSPESKTYKANSFSGHLNSAYVSATCELVIDVAEGRVDRKFSDEIGLNLLEF